MIEIIRQLALDVAENGADFSIGTVVKENPVTIRLEENMELSEEFLILTEHVLETEETGRICLNGNDWNSCRMKRDRRLKTGEAVALLRAVDGQQYLVLGRVRKEE